MNAISLIGRLTKDIELKDIGEGRLVTSNTLAVRKTYKKDGSSDADFIPFVAWGKRAELLEEYCSKGDLIGLTGRMQSRSYKTESEDMRYVVEMLVEDLEFLQKKSPDKVAANPS
ncbi:single-stranded DNA-binding protein [Alkalibacterium thalassium]|uniref:Single-stranded DNA-binding protein n=1 Tax=Alkalibacterium thalassium TaxID=426701 RepID=A0A1G8Z1K4_9LACT|nr:single-stranded DNA-binding protein [Alkalibacterium thalassium]SDK08847.1 single-strand DNA-binding protein [Alkalibacterium thalassium]